MIFTLRPKARVSARRKGREWALMKRQRAGKTGGVDKPRSHPGGLEMAGVHAAFDRGFELSFKHIQFKVQHANILRQHFL